MGVIVVFILHESMHLYCSMHMHSTDCPSSWYSV